MRLTRSIKTLENRHKYLVQRVESTVPVNDRIKAEIAALETALIELNVIQALRTEARERLVNS